MTHDRGAGNQPRLRLNLPVQDHVFDFIMTGIAGFCGTDDAHSREIRYRVEGRGLLRFVSCA
jgi:hypothetical protein